MEDILKMDIFFFVTTLVVLVLGVLAGMVLYRLWKILKNVEHISGQVAQESEIIRQDIASLRSDIKEGKGKLMSTLSFFSKLSDTGNRKRAKKID